MMIFGGSKSRVRTDWGVPAKMEAQLDGTEVWTYESRQNGKTFVFYFDQRGKLIETSIL